MGGALATSLKHDTRPVMPSLGESFHDFKQIVVCRTCGPLIPSTVDRPGVTVAPRTRELDA